MPADNRTRAGGERVPLMPLIHAHDALGDQVSHFYNDCLRRGITELPPRKWIEEFRSWLNAYEFERQYADTLEWIAGTEVVEGGDGNG